MVYDCFTFFNELELLEIRLAELNEVVDYFVLVEGTHTFTGIEKKLYFKDSKEKFSKYLNKIIHVVIDDYTNIPDIRKMKFYNQNLGYRLMVEKNREAWSIEAYQRNSILNGLKNCKDSDIILISDVDEIPKKNAVQELFDKKLSGEVVGFEQDMYVFFVNAKCYKKWVGTKAVLFDHLYSPQEIRLGEATTVIKNGGWHFSFLGGVDRIVDKLNAFSHQELNIEERQQKEVIEFFLDIDINILESGQAYETVDNFESLPRYILENKERFGRLFKEKKEFTHFTKQQVDILKREVIRLQEQNNELKMENEKLNYLVIQNA